MNDIEYVREQDKQEYLKFFAHHLRSFGRPPASELWHYTDAEGLMGIVASGQLWCTQVACLNDSLEQRYFGDLVHAAVKARRANNTDPHLAILLRVADEFLDGQDFAAAGRFVACFSEIEDDLGQWRGYGGGQCGYSISRWCLPIGGMSAWLLGREPLNIPLDWLAKVLSRAAISIVLPARVGTSRELSFSSWDWRKNRSTC
jgi:hypothetical protein